ncbi:MAG: hypothetical protein ACXWB9_01490 [Flavisolibacter sp.]
MNHFNPFYPFTQNLLYAFVAAGKKYYVRQAFGRGRNTNDQNVSACLLITHYESPTTAMDHFGAISYDPHRFLYSWDEPSHRERLQMAAAGPEGYKIFAAVLRPDWERPVDVVLKKKLRLYIENLGWRPGRDEGVRTNYEMQFGELYIRIKYGGREAKVKFDEIENCI